MRLLINDHLPMRLLINDHLLMRLLINDHLFFTHRSDVMLLVFNLSFECFNTILIIL